MLDKGSEWIQMDSIWEKKKEPVQIILASKWISFCLFWRPGQNFDHNFLSYDEASQKTEASENRHKIFFPILSCWPRQKLKIEYFLTIFLAGVKPETFFAFVYYFS